MTVRILAAAAVTAAIALPAQAQIGATRRFTHSPTDVNRNNVVAYIPVASAFPGRRPADMPYDVSSATWHAERLGVVNEPPDKTLDKFEYRLERFELNGKGADRRLVAVITQKPAPPDGTPAPELHFVSADTAITTRAQATVNAVPGGVQYSFQAVPAMLALAPESERAQVRIADRYELRFMTARDVNYGPRLTRAPTFDGDRPFDWDHPAPPQLPKAERDTGRRIVRTGPSDPGQVVDYRVAGSRQELREKKRKR